MKLYEVKKGTHSALYLHDRVVFKFWEVRKDIVFQDYEMIFDPIAYHNGRLDNDWHIMMSKRGLAGFQKGGESDKAYLLIVPYAKVNVMC